MSAPEASPTAPMPGAEPPLDETPSTLPDPALLGAVADTLLPGDGLFPPASAVGAHGLLAERLRERLGVEGLDRFTAALAAASDDRSFAALAGGDRAAAVRRLEEEDPELFALLRTILYYAYYQSPLVVRAVRALGWDYNDAPQPLGYDLAAFDPTPGANLPATPRGSYKRTEEITRIDLGPLAAAGPVPRSRGDATS